METNDKQHQAMRHYASLASLHEDWGGRLVLFCSPGCAESIAVLAVSIAGGTSLVIDSGTAEMKSAMRSGQLDFVVNTLDEALRTLKNEIRQRRTLGVGLIADVDSVLAEMVERGVQPDVHFVPPGCTPGGGDFLLVLKQRGMQQMYGAYVKDELGYHYPSFEPLLILNRKRYYEHFVAASDATALAAIDAELLRMIPLEDGIRRRWIAQIPRFLREARTGGRWIWLSDDEREQFASRGLLGESHQSRP